MGVGIHVEQFAGDQKLIATKYASYKLNRRITNALTTQTHFEHVVVLGRCVVFQAGLFDIQIATQLMHGVFVRNGQRAPIVRHGGIKVHQVVAIEDNFLQVYLYPAHPQAV